MKQKEGIRDGTESGTCDKKDQRTDDTVGCVSLPYGRAESMGSSAGTVPQDHALPGCLRG